MPDRARATGRGTEVALRNATGGRRLAAGVDGMPRRGAVMRVLSVCVLVAAVALAGSPADAAVTSVRRGLCSGPSRWRLAVVPDEGVLRVRLAVRGGRAGQRWNIFMDHDGTGFFAGHRISGTDGLWVVRRRVANLAGVDTIRFGAHNVATGETCRGRASA
jgi:hypothetical protein